MSPSTSRQCLYGMPVTPIFLIEYGFVMGVFSLM